MTISLFAIRDCLEKEDLLKLIKNFSSHGVQEIRFTGGEPLLFNGIYDLIKDDTVNGTTKRYLIEDFDKILSLDLIKEDNNIDSELEKYIQDKIEERKIAKQNKDYALSDAIRDELLTKGIELIDTREGTTYKINK